MGNNAIEIAGLRVVRGGIPVIPSLDLAVPVGQVVGLLGPSGSGKTTLMRAVVGVQAGGRRHGAGARSARRQPPTCAAGSAT